jgi:hypothetical protein
MAVPRPILLAVLGLFLLSATFLATRNAREQGSDSGTQAAQPSPAKQSHAAKPAAKPAQKPAHKKDQATQQARPARRHSPLSKPAAVARAIGNGRLVVLGFFQPGADDRADKAAVAAVKGRGVAVFSDSIDHIGRYGPVVGALGIHQAPAIVIVDSQRHARLIEGYVDPESLTQEVADARR